MKYGDKTKRSRSLVRNNSIDELSSTRLCRSFTDEEETTALDYRRLQWSKAYPLDYFWSENDSFYECRSLLRIPILL